MIGLLRYAFLKHSRDGSLVTLLVAPSVMVVLPMLVIWIIEGSNAPRIPAEGATALTVLMGSLMATISSFMLYRTEIANHSIGSLVLATRSWMVPLSSAIYGSLVGMAATVATGLAFAATNGGTLPHEVRTYLLEAIVLTSMTASVATLTVMLSRSMAAIGWIYGGTVLLLVSVLESGGTMALLATISPIVSAVCVTAAAVILERRCAS